MVVYLPVHGEHQLSIFTEKGLPSRCRVDNGEPLVCHDGFVAGEDTGPIGTAVTQLGRHFK